MPELPEVETVLRGVSPHISGRVVAKVEIRQFKLRWQINPDLSKILSGQRLKHCSRRAKYLLLHFETGVLIIHLGMSGSLRIYTDHAENTPAGKHDHLDIFFSDKILLRYHDPRKFGAILWYEGAAEFHPLLEKLGCEPLSDDFNEEYVWQKTRTQKRSLKQMLMDNAFVSGVGNIYANESLFRASLSPFRAANTLSREECSILCQTIKDVLTRAIGAGGSTLKDFVDSDGKSGYFQQEYTVYGREGENCLQCGGVVERKIQAQRSTFFCPNCQHYAV